MLLSVASVGVPLLSAELSDTLSLVSNPLPSVTGSILRAIRGNVFWLLLLFASSLRILLVQQELIQGNAFRCTCMRTLAKQRRLCVKHQTNAMTKLRMQPAIHCRTSTLMFK